MIKSMFVAMVCAIIMSTQAFGAGFALYEHSSRGVALGGAFVAQADDPSALYYNPAGITSLDGIRMMAGFSAIIPDISITNPSGNNDDIEKNVFFPPHLYVTYKLNDRFSFGLGVFSPFGLSTEFDENWDGRYNSYLATIETVNVNPNIAVKVSDSLSVALGCSIQHVDVEFKQKIRPADVIRASESNIKMGIAQSYGLDPDSAQVDMAYKTNFLKGAAALGDIDQKIEGDHIDMGFNIAVHYQPTDRLSFGVTYRSGIDQDLDGKAYYDNVSEIPGVFNFSDVFYNASGSGKLALPDFFTMGVAYKVTENLILEADAWRTGWSSYKDLPLVIENGLGDRTQQKDYDDVWTFRFGAEYKISDTWTARLGYVYDQSPIPDETIDYSLPSNDRHLFNSGLGFRYKNFVTDAYFTYLIAKDRHIDARPEDYILEGDVEGSALLMGLSFSYEF